MGDQDFTDGVWIWPQGLAHYVDTHDAGLPDAFLQHARANRFRIAPFSLDALFPNADEDTTREGRASPAVG